MVDDADRASFRIARGIGDSVASCHTAVVDGYTIEGHVPVAAISRLLSEQPEAAGLALPGMPNDAPGMGGDEASWAVQPVMLVGRDGAHRTWDY